MKYYIYTFDISVSSSQNGYDLYKNKIDQTKTLFELFVILSLLIIMIDNDIYLIIKTIDFNIYNESYIIIVMSDRYDKYIY